MSVFKVAIIMPNATVVADPECTFKHFCDQVFEKLSKGEIVKFNSADNDVCVMYSHIPGVPLTIMTEKRLEKIRREQQYAMAMQQGGGIIKSQ